MYRPADSPCWLDAAGCRAGEAPGPPLALLPGLGEADQERSSLALRMAGAAADPERSFRATVIRGDMSRLSRSWNGSLVPRLRFVITAGAAKCVSDLQICPSRLSESNR